MSDEKHERIDIRNINAGDSVDIDVRQETHHYGFSGAWALGVVFVVGLIGVIGFWLIRPTKSEDLKEQALYHAESGEELFRIAVQNAGHGSLSSAGEQRIIESLVWAAQYAQPPDIDIFIGRICSESPALPSSVLGCALWLATLKGSDKSRRDVSAIILRGKPSPDTSSIAIRDKEDWVVIGATKMTVGRAADVEYFRSGSAHSSTAEYASAISWWEAFALTEWMGGRLATSEEMIAYLKERRADDLNHIWLLALDRHSVSAPGWISALRYDQGVLHVHELYASNVLPGLRFVIVFDAPIH